MMLAPTTIEVTFPLVLDGGEDTERTVELRASVTFRGVDDAPEVDPLEPAHWVDSLGNERLPWLTDGSHENPAWVGARERATDAAFDALMARIARAS